ncbi:DUF5658 family protein [Planomicrobium sp. CPCC 101079]|uniref:DUF5658 family protein n=1 Tax=Planomicrobium sp. CPCC 101079 TaxID=2599618 RepID=UPI0011B4F88D|nr:DUF5658 family protein [Planomicrobium sp. CPCC 101079]TWT11139.1 hypothetical protein FQV28_04300 [Planomicrobium sp. CPCC 101079]
MIAIENNTPLKKHIWALILLNVLDGTLTYWGLTFGFINEGNPLLQEFSPFAIFSIKLLLSFFLFCLLFTPFVFVQSGKWRFFLISTNMLYSVILLLHVIWISFLVMA